MSLAGKRIVVTGGAGFLGSHVVEEVRRRGAAEVVVPRKKDYDLVDGAAAKRLLEDARPDLVLHLAARVGGIGANRENPGSFFYDNLMMGVQLVEECRRQRVSKVRDRGDDLLLPQVHARALPRGRDLERLPGGDERPLRAGQEDAARPGPGLPPAVRDGRRAPPAREPLRPPRQLRPRLLPRDPRPHQEVPGRDRPRRGHDRGLGDGTGLARVPVRGGRGPGHRPRRGELQRRRSP